jgi:hypothetical protein
MRAGIPDEEPCHAILLIVVLAIVTHRRLQPDALFVAHVPALLRGRIRQLPARVAPQTSRSPGKRFC